MRNSFFDVLVCIRTKIQKSVVQVVNMNLFF